MTAKTITDDDRIGRKLELWNGFETIHSPNPQWIWNRVCVTVPVGIQLITHDVRYLKIWNFEKSATDSSMKMAHRLVFDVVLSDLQLNYSKRGYLCTLRQRLPKCNWRSTYLSTWTPIVLLIKLTPSSGITWQFDRIPATWIIKLIVIEKFVQRRIINAK